MTFLPRQAPPGVKLSLINQIIGNVVWESVSWQQFSCIGFQIKMHYNSSLFSSHFRNAKAVQEKASIREDCGPLSSAIKNFNAHPSPGELHTSPMTGLYFWDLPRVSQFLFRYFDSIYILLYTSICIVLIPVADAGEGPGVPVPLPLICRPNWGPKGRKIFYLTPPPTPCLDDNGIFRRFFSDGHNQSLLLSAV